MRNYQWHGFFALGGLVNVSPDPIAAAMPYLHHPPLVVWLSALPVLLTGYSEALLRFVAACCTILSTAAIYVLARRLAGQKYGFWSAVFFALTPMMAYFGRMPDHEAPALLICLLFAAVLVDWLRRPTRRGWWVLVLLTVLAVWTAWGAVIVIGVLGVMALFHTRRRAAVIMLGIVALGALIALLGYFVYLVPDAISDLINAFVWRTSTNSLEPGAADFAWSQYGLRVVVRLLTLYAPTVMVLALIGIRFTRRGLHRGTIVALPAAGFGYMLVFRNASYIHDYYMIFTAPGIALLAGGAVALLPRTPLRWLRPLVVSLVVFLPIGLVRYVDDLYVGSDASMLTFARIIREHTEPGDVIMSDLPTIGYAIEFYAERAVQWDTPPAQAIGQTTVDDHAVYLLYCGGDLPDGVVLLSQVEVGAQCRLARLR